jgi:large subunit ribosomal protein L13
MSTTTYMPKPGEIQRDWLVVDATDQVLGRLAAKVAVLLQGKHKPTFAPHVDTGDFVIVLNAAKVKVTGRKADVMEYDKYTRYPGGRHLTSYKTMLEKDPHRVIEIAVKRMLPKSKMGKHYLGKLRVEKGDTHEYQAQQPKAVKL